MFLTDVIRQIWQAYRAPIIVSIEFFVAFSLFGLIVSQDFRDKTVWRLTGLIRELTPVEAQFYGAFLGLLGVATVIGFGFARDRSRIKEENENAADLKRIALRAEFHAFDQYLEKTAGNASRGWRAQPQSPAVWMTTLAFVDLPSIESGLDDFGGCSHREMAELGNLRANYLQLKRCYESAAAGRAPINELVEGVCLNCWKSGYRMMHFIQDELDKKGRATEVWRPKIPPGQ